MTKEQQDAVKAKNKAIRDLEVKYFSLDDDGMAPGSMIVGYYR